MSESRGYRDFEGYPAEKNAEERSWSELAPDLPEHEHQCSGYCNDFYPPGYWDDPDAEWHEDERYDN